MAQPSKTTTNLVASHDVIEVQVKANPDNEMAEYAAQAIYDQLDMASFKPLNITVEEIKSALVSFVILKTNPKIDIDSFREKFLIPSFLYNILSKLESASSTKVMYSIVKLDKENYDKEAMYKFHKTLLSFGKNLPIAVESGFPKNKVKDDDVIAQMLTNRRVEEGIVRPLDGESHPEAWRQAVYLNLEHIDNPTLNEFYYGPDALAKALFHEVSQ